MKILPLIISILILSILCSPVLAISAGDLISNHRTGSFSFINTTDRHSLVTPTALPSPRVTFIPFPTRNGSVHFDLPSYRSIFTLPIITPKIIPSPVITPKIVSERTLTCPPDKPIGELHHCLCSCVCFEGYDCGDCINPETGWPYPMAMDRVGRLFIVKEGCPAKWADE